jgi:hypothetical protein
MLGDVLEAFVPELVGPKKDLKGVKYVWGSGF